MAILLCVCQTARKKAEEKPTWKSAVFCFFENAGGFIPDAESSVIIQISNFMSKQKTLGGSFSLFGKGLHTGLNLTVTFNPAPENHGYKIQRIDLDGQPIIEAIAENVVDTSRGTVVAKGDARCSTIEHGMAALYAMGIDNCLIQVNGPEFPILDGSSKMYVENIRRVGIEVQNAPKDFYVIKKKIEFRDEETGSSIIICQMSSSPSRP